MRTQRHKDKSEKTPEPTRRSNRNTSTRNKSKASGGISADPLSGLDL